VRDELVLTLGGRSETEAFVEALRRIAEPELERTAKEPPRRRKRHKMRDESLTALEDEVVAILKGADLTCRSGQRPARILRSVVAFTLPGRESVNLDAARVALARAATRNK
jgi:hypothetical protein